MEYVVKMSCGHESKVNIYCKTEEDRVQRIKYLERFWICRQCYIKQKNIENAEKCSEVKVSYSEYKKEYAHLKFKIGSYDSEDKTIIIYMPKKINNIL